MNFFCSTILTIASAVFGQTENSALKANQAAERVLIEHIREIRDRARTGLDPESDFKVRQPELEELIKLVDELLTQFPETAHRDEAMIAKLTALAELARRDPINLQRLLVVTNRIAEDDIKGPLRAESDYFALEAFVLAARREGMEEERRMEGARERYRAYLEDHPNSPHANVVRASLIRLLLAMERIDEAKTDLEYLRKNAPDDRPTRRAEGEVFRVTTVGQPFTPLLRNFDGSAKKPEDFRGHVLIVHFWASTVSRSVDELATLRTFFAKHRTAKLKCVGVNVDANEEAAKRALMREFFPWPQVAERKGFEADTVYDTGVIQLPTYYVIDADGIVRLVSGSVGEVIDTVEQLLTPAGPVTPVEP